jgi:hypothetical protein
VWVGVEESWMANKSLGERGEVGEGGSLREADRVDDGGE